MVFSKIFIKFHQFVVLIIYFPVTEALVRKRSEHNELMISTLEELSLHQEDIEKIEHIHNWCRDLKILLLQSNLIGKIENLNKLKKLEYLNLAINNIEVIENLDQLESLNKLDLTLNFIGELTSLESLKDNYNLKELFLTGNPCTDYPEYRDYVIATLPQLQVLDGTEITRTDRLKAVKNLNEYRKNIVQRQAKYKIERAEQRKRMQNSIQEQEESVKDLDDQEKSEKFWQQKSEHCPETRILMAKYSRRGKDNSRDGNLDVKTKKKRQIKFFAEDGRPYSINEAKLDFKFTDEPDRFELDLQIYKFLDTSLIDVDVQPNYVRVTIKGKVFQMGLNEEVKTEESSSQRSQISGRLVIKMPKLNYNEEVFKQKAKIEKDDKEKPRDLKGCVNIRNITTNGINLDEIPDLI